MGVPNCLPSCGSNLSHISSWRPQTEIRLHSFLFSYDFSFINISHSRAWLSPPSPSPCSLVLPLHPLHRVRTKRRKSCQATVALKLGYLNNFLRSPFYCFLYSALPFLMRSRLRIRSSFNSFSLFFVLALCFSFCFCWFSGRRAVVVVVVRAA